MKHYVRHIRKAQLKQSIAMQREDGSMAQAHFKVRRRRGRKYAYIQWRDGRKIREKYWGVVID